MTNLPSPNIELSNGVQVPQLGFGVYLVGADTAEQTVLDALETGYRHIDTAKLYGNEAEVGRAVRASGLPREDVFVTTKLWNNDQTRAAAAFDESLDRLGLDYVDLFLIHWPQPMFGEALGAWKELIKIGESGRARAVGVCNFEVPHLKELIDETGVVPAVNQIELHPLHQRRELVEFCRDNGIAVEAWGPLAQGKTDILERPEVVAAAAAHGKTPAQVVLRWHLQQDRIIFPKTSRRERMVENASLFDFELSAAEMAAIDALDEGKNMGPDPQVFDKR